MFMAVTDEDTRRNFWNHHSLNYLETMIQRAQAEAAPNLSPEATNENAIDGSNDNESELVVTPSKFDDIISEEIILEESAEKSDESIHSTLKEKILNTSKLLTVFMH